MQEIKNGIDRTHLKCFYHSNDLLFACYLFDIDVKEAAAYNHVEKRYKILDDL